MLDLEREQSELLQLHEYMKLNSSASGFLLIQMQNENQQMQQAMP